MSRLLVIGESCVDVFSYGECDRLCPAAPVPVFRATETKKHLKKESGGRAMNVYANMLSLGANAEIYTNDTWKEISKTRYVDYRTNYIILRLDANEHLYGRCNLEEIDFTNYDAAVISDYDKGFVTKEDIEYISSHIPITFLDTKKIIGPWANNVSYIKINNNEFERTKYKISNELTNKIIVTLGPDGCRYNDLVYPVPEVEIRDTSGAGDTFMAALAIEYMHSGNIVKAIKFANNCATKTVQKKGVTTI